MRTDMSEKVFRNDKRCCHKRNTTLDLRKEIVNYRSICSLIPLVRTEVYYNCAYLDYTQT